VIASTMHGRAELVFARRGARTILAHSRVEAPMATVRPFELPDGGLVIQLITLGPGLCAGDSVHLDIEAGEGARVVVTTTAAARVMSMEAGSRAEQHVRLRAARHATLEYYPCVTIPFPGSAFEQTVHAAADADARIGVLEAWALGRTARDEYLQFTRIASRTTLEVDGAIIHMDVTDLDPSSHGDLAGAGVLDRRRYVASGFWYGVTLEATPEPSGREGAARGLSSLNKDQIAERGARLARRDDREYREYLREEQRSQTGCPAREVVLDQRGQTTSVAFGQSRPHLAYLRALGDEGPALDAVLRRSVELVGMAWRLPAVQLNRFRC